MVQIAIAGGSGQVAREVIDALLATEKHHIIVLSRNVHAAKAFPARVEVKAVDYHDKEGLTKVLTGIHTLLSFVQLLSDPEQQSQKNLIDAAISARVQRFAPSEYGSKGTVGMPWWNGKETIRAYLQKAYENENMLEYTLFQPGLFLDYLAYPHKTTKYIDPLQPVFDLKNRRAMIVEGHEDAIMTLTTAADFARIVARAVSDEHKWPTVSGIQGNRLTFAQIIEISGRVRGRPFAVDTVKIEDLEAGNLITSWNIEAVHAAVDDIQASAMRRMVSIGMLLSSAKGAWDISDEMNRRFLDESFRSAEDFLTEVWSGKA